MLCINTFDFNNYSMNSSRKKASDEKENLLPKNQRPDSMSGPAETENDLQNSQTAGVGDSVAPESPSSKNADSDLYLVAVGASAGGLDALQELLANIPDRIVKQVSFIVAQHVSPTHKSMLVQLLGRQTRLSVTDARENLFPQAGYVYVTPPDSEIYFKNGHMRLRKPVNAIGPKPSVDVLLESLCVDSQARKMIGIILSGTGSDGAEGFRLLKKAGGFLIAQEPQTARYDGMPIAAINTGAADSVVAPEKMGEEIADYIAEPVKNNITFFEQEDLEADSLKHIFNLLGKRTGTDFSNYKSATIGRRLNKRLDMLEMESLEEYVRYLRENPGELDEMFQMILIGVTTFFRNQAAFDALREYLDAIIKEKSSAGIPLRVWVPGCSTGEEAYSIAILISELLREQGLQSGVQIFATDIDEKAINMARLGIYSKDSIAPLSEDLIRRYFEKRENGWEVIKALRSMVLFSKHDLTNNPPFLKLDLISCRNLLIYLNAGMQQQIIPLFHYALNHDGILLLGKSETVGQHNDLFATADSKNKIYQRKRGAKFNSVKLSAFKTRKQLATRNVPAAISRPEPKDYSISDMVKETLFNTFEHPYVVVDDSYEIQEINGDVRLYMSLSEGSLQANLLKMVNQELQIEVRSVMNRVLKERNSIKSNIRRFELYGQEYYVRITGKPLLYSEAPNDLYVVIFEQLDIQDFLNRDYSYEAGEEGEAAGQRIKELEMELEATREHLQTYIEEIETSNEELQSLNEELQSTNEELQSSNEELETSNEELQSTSEEVQIAYSELKSSNEQLARKERKLREQEAGLQALLSNRLQAMMLVDSGYGVLEYNEPAAVMFRELRGKELSYGSVLVDFLDSGYIETFLRDFARAMEGEQVSGQLKTHNASGDQSWRWFHINYTPVITDEGKVSYISLSMLETTALKRATREAQYKERLVQSVYDAASVGICVTDADGYFVNVNRRYREIYGFENEDLIGRHFTMVVPEEARGQARELHDAFISDGSEPPREWQGRHSKGHLITVEVSARLLIQEDGSRYKVTSVDNVSEHRQLQIMLESTNSMVQLGSWEMDTRDGLITYNPILADIFELEDPHHRCTPEQMGEFFRNSRSRDRFLKMITALRSGDQTDADAEFKFRTNSGQYRWLRFIARAEKAQGQCISIQGVMQDISKEKENRNVLRLYESAMKEATDAILITESDPIDMPGPRIVFTNHAFSEMTGYDPEELIGNTPRMLQGPLTSRKELNRLRKAMENEEACSIEVVNYTKTGEEYWVSIQVTPIADERGNHTHFLSIQKDITQRKSRELQKLLLADISGLFHQDAPLQDILKQCTKSIAENGLFDVAEIWLLDTPGDSLRLTAVYATDKVAGFHTDSTDITMFAPGEGLPGQVWQQQTRLYWKNIHVRKDFERREAAAAAGLKTAYGVPVFSNGSIFGVLMLATKEEQNSPLESAMAELGDRLGSEIRRKHLEEELQHTFSYAPEIVCIAGTDGYFKKVNPAMIRQLGYSEKQLLGQPMNEFIYYEDRDANNQILETLGKSGETQRYENRYITREGDIIWLSWSSTPVQEGGIVYSIAKDITRQRELELLFSQVNKMARIGAWELHVATGELYWSPVLHQIFEVADDYEPTAENGLSFYAGESQKEIEALFTKAIESGESWDEELRVVTAAGNPRWIRVIGQVLMNEGEAIKVFGSLQDIHPLKTTQIELENTLAEKDTILDRVGDGFYALNPDWTVIYWNTAAEEILSTPKEKIIGRNVWEVFSDAQELDFYTYYKQAMESQTKKHFESYYPGAQIWVEVNVYPSPSGLSVFFKDITKRKEAALELQRLNRNLEQQTRELAVSNADLEQFAFVASHDLQEPLRMITSFMARLEKKYGQQLDDKARRYIHFATDGARRMRTIILDLLEFSRVGRVETEVEPVDLNVMMEEVEKLNSKIIRETDAEILYDNLPVMQLNRFSIRQLFQNLIQNAVKYRKPGERPRIRVTAGQQDDSGEWTFAVADNGIGMDQKYESKIFAIFQRLHSTEEYEGNGVGLAICKKIVEQHKGRMWVETAIGEGSTFYFTLQAWKAVLQRSVPLPEQGSSGLKIRRINSLDKGFI
jgi:two-component system CheB/CheR fusion protein